MDNNDDQDQFDDLPIKNDDILQFAKCQITLGKNSMLMNILPKFIFIIFEVLASFSPKTTS